MSKYEDFREECIDRLSKEDFNHIDKLVLLALEDEKTLTDYYGWNSRFCKEKHDALNYSYHISIYKEQEESDFEIELTFYTGIDVGCELEHYSLDGCSIVHQPNMVNVLVDLKLDWSRIKKGANPKLAQYMLDGAKERILELYSKQNYDNYVTGGGTAKTNKHYKKEIESYNNRGLYWTCVYEEQEFDRNIV